MVRTLQAETITLQELIRLYGLQLVEEEQFFPEWRDNLPEHTDLEKQLLDQVKAGYIKLVQGNPPRYATSDLFDIRNRGNELYQVLSILKYLSHLSCT